MKFEGHRDRRICPKCFAETPNQQNISKLTVSHHYGQKDTKSLWPDSHPPHQASSPANEAKVL